MASLDTMLLIDGYNIIGAWPKLEATKAKLGLAEARQGLTEAIASYVAFQGYRTRIVFDAHYQQQAAHCEQITAELELYFTDAGQTADSHIEWVCAQARHTITPYKRIIVATSDRDHRLTVTGYGAEWMSAQQLIQRVALSTHRIRDRAQQAKGRSRRTLAATIDPVVQQKLNQLRFGYPP
ncbi:NYN domain-containing protein [Lyngbya confervoides]|uniref:NYN domain-containing protein n=1 Tax=Lyngbya confervoides BDU141951 TaxID=1574623 RepID=A0ABD4SY22_9CYAN|nr:NYN domain-containing protein [Lyngbya confervoides]MCM1981259.1 NYN domain-containing protein [Lyngbya confervoides BDU141951]